MFAGLEFGDITQGTQVVGLTRFALIRGRAIVVTDSFVRIAYTKNGEDAVKDIPRSVVASADSFDQFLGQQSALSLA